MSDGLMFTEWKNISMNELNMRDVTVNRSYHIRKPLDKALDHLKIDLERDKTELVNFRQRTGHVPPELTAHCF